MQIVVRQISGLGNQLFQYAAGRYYAKRYQAEMRIVTDPEQKAVSHGLYPRPFLLSHFSITAPHKSLSLYDRILLSGRPLVKEVRKLLRVQLFTEPPRYRSRFIADLPLEPNIDTLYLFGYWQTHFIVDAIAEDLRVELRFKEPARANNLDVLLQIKQTADSVSLHVRRGDYTLAIENNIALPLDYYVRAISLFKQRLHDPTFFVFSDDIPYVRQNLPQGVKAVFVDHNDSFSSHEDLRLMSACRHHIIANSSFSWWGAWLNPLDEKMVIAPKHWLLRDDSHYSELIPANWILLDSCRQP